MQGGVHGIHLVVLYVVYGTLKFPVGYRAWLALDLLATVPQPIRWRFDVCVLQGSGFESATFLQGMRDEGFEFVVGVRSNRRTDHSGRVTVSDCEHGSWLSLHNWPWEVVTLARFDRGDRTFFSVSPERENVGGRSNPSWGSPSISSG